MPISVALVDLSKAYREVNEPLGIENLGGALHSRFGGDITISYLSLLFSDLQSVIRRCIGKDIIGISMPIGTLELFDSLYANLHEVSSTKTLMVLGGTLPTSAGQHLLSRYRDVVLVKGEGEDAICSIVETYKDSAPYLDIDTFLDRLCHRNVPNVSFWGSGGELVETRVELVHLDSLPLPDRFFLRDTVERRGIVRVESSRGCPWGRCSFCSIPQKYGAALWRPFAVDRVLSDLRVISDSGGLSPYFTDEDFLGGNGKHGFELASAIISDKQTGRLRSSLNFYIGTSVMSILDKEKEHTNGAFALLSQLREAGVREIFVGVESASDSQLRRYKKGVTATENLRVLRMLRSLGFSIDIGFILFDPQMNLDELGANLDFIIHNGLDFSDARLTKSLRIFPGTPYASLLINKQIIDNVYDVGQLVYSYRFQDPHIQQIHDAFLIWEKDILDYVYLVQGDMRGETSSEDFRLRTKSILGQIRRFDIEFLKSAVDICKSSTTVPVNLVDLIEQKTQIFMRRRSAFGDLGVAIPHDL